MLSKVKDKLAVLSFLSLRKGTALDYLIWLLETIYTILGNTAPTLLLYDSEDCHFQVKPRAREGSAPGPCCSTGTPATWDILPGRSHGAMSHGRVSGKPNKDSQC